MNTEEQPKQTVVDFQLQANIIVLKLLVNGIPKNFALDTGASRSVIAKQDASELGLKEVMKEKGRGAGGEIEVSLARLNSLTLGNAVFRDFPCVVADLEEINKAVGGGISGILGFDFLSKFKVTIDYRERKLTFELYEHKELESFVIKGDLFISPRFKLELKRPDPSWEFIKETPLPQIPVILQKKGSTGKVIIQVQEVHGLSLDQLVPSLEASVAIQIKNFKKISSTKMKHESWDYYLMEYFGEKDGGDKQFKHFFIKIKEKLYSINFHADPSEFPSISQEFDKIFKSIRFTK